jgi:hypothetical protein
MRTLLIVFAILLLLLTLLGAFGGSIKYNEPFFDVINDKANLKKNKFAQGIRGSELFSNENKKQNTFVDGQMPTMPDMPNMAVPKMPTEVSNFLDALPSNSSLKLPAAAPALNIQPLPSMSSASASVSGSHFYEGPEPVISKPAFLEKPQSQPQQSNFTDSFNIEPFEADKHSSLPAVY